MGRLPRNESFSERGEAVEDGESHADIGATVTEENRFLYAFHTNNGGPREGRN